MSYAANTTVSQERSKQEIERTLIKYGAKQFVYGWDGDMMTVGFLMESRMVQFKIRTPSLSEIERPTRVGYGKSVNSIMEDRLEQSKRQRWRALALVIKAKLEAVESGITHFEQEFLAHIVLPNKQTVGEWLSPQIEEAYENKTMPKLLLGTGK